MATTAQTDSICLVIPPSTFLLDERVFVSLGILKVAAVLEEAGRAVQMLDLSGIENYLDVVDLHVRTARPTIVALTTTTPQLPAANRIAQRVREVAPDTRLVLGGPHVTLVQAAVRNAQKSGRTSRAHAALARLLSVFDVLVSGDGELAVLRAIEPGARGMIDADDPLSGLFISNEFLEKSPLPARHLVALDTYKYEVCGQKATSLIAQLGCPFGCRFCGGRLARSMRTIRTRTTRSIVRELEQLHREYGYTGFMFYDDELNVSQSLVELMDAISDLQSRLGVEFRLRGFVKAELFNDAQAHAMYRAGFRWLLSGFESADPKILKNINKKATREDNTRMLETARRHGLKVKALMSVGHPGESPDSIQAIHDWLLATAPDDLDCSIITTYPGTPYYDDAVAHDQQPGVWTYTCPGSGDRLHSHDVDFSQVAEYYKGDPNGGYRSYVFTDHLTADELVAMRDWVERDVRRALGIPFNPSQTAKRYEHSMGMSKLPPFLLNATPSLAPEQ